jgi:hypothetical protein
MKKRLFIGLVVGLCFGLAGSAIAAQTGTSTVAIYIGDIDELSVGGGGTITLGLKGGAGSNLLTGADNAGARLNYSSNSTTAKEIKAEVRAADMPEGSQDITLTIQVEGGAGSQTLVSGGTTQGAKTVYTGINAGTLKDKTVTYHATTTASGTRPGSYQFTVTFTSQ